MTEDPDPETVLLGEYEIPDAQKLLAALEAAQIPFEVDPVDLRSQIPTKGAWGHCSRLQVWIRPADQDAAQTLQTQSLKIEL